jgi:hypothetical protein
MEQDSMTLRIPALFASLAAIGLLAACDSGDAGGQHTNYHAGRDPTAQSGGGGLTLFSSGHAAAQDDGSGVAVNAYLWRGALETLKFMPLASADPFGGVIITDWWTPASASDERFKATAYILGRQLRTDGLRISVFRQVQQNGQWVDAPVDPGKATELENMVLAKARDLRAQSASSQ